MKSIRARLIVMVLSVILISLGSLPGLSYYFSKQILSVSVDDTVTAMGTDYAKRLNKGLSILRE